MLSEVCNALVLTYLATEYLIATNVSTVPLHKQQRGYWKEVVSSRRNIAVIVVVGLVNLIDRVSGLKTASFLATTTHFVQSHQLFFRIIFAALAYLVVLYWDCRRINPALHLSDFLSATGAAFLYILPVYPLLAVLISFGFMIVIDLFELFKLPLEWLNAPIYYGTLYGPFSTVYLRVKRSVVQARTSLPV